MIHAFRGLLRQLQERRQRCSLCGVRLGSAASVTSYGFYRFCSPEHYEEWRRFTVL